jgi:ATP-dependent Clp protease ATP-binding subunit ClpA
MRLCQRITDGCPSVCASNRSERLYGSALSVEKPRVFQGKKADLTRSPRHAHLTGSSKRLAGYVDHMPGSPATVEQLARDTARTGDPETALRALTALRNELNQLESELVHRALRAGCSWSQIARALGITKQAAHHRHHQLAEEPSASTDGQAKMLVTSEARRAIQLARQEAATLGQPVVCTEHILLGILRCERSHAVNALNALGVTHQAARDCLQTTMPGVPLKPDSTEGPADDDGVSPHARRILEGSLREALKRNEGYIGVEHLLLSLLSDSRNGAVQTLEMLKTTPSEVRRQLDQEWQKLAARAQAEAD